MQNDARYICECEAVIDVGREEVFVSLAVFEPSLLKSPLESLPARGGRRTALALDLLSSFSLAYARAGFCLMRTERTSSA